MDKHDVLEIDKDQISAFIPQVEDQFFTDSAYAVLDENWVAKEGYKGFKNWLKFAGLQKWKRNWDCDNMATSFKLYMQMLHAKYNPYSFTERFKKVGTNGTNVESIAVGDIFYKINGDERRAHAINLLICAQPIYSRTKNENWDKHELKKVYFEPENGHIVDLSEVEEASIWYASF